MTASPAVSGGVPAASGLEDDCAAGLVVLPSAASGASSARSGRRKVYVRPTGVNLTLTYGRAGQELIVISIPAELHALECVLDLERQPVSYDLRACVPFERLERTVDR
jgi:hypothetical protein